jgi:NADH-quinone oxidoreductase subunit L
VIWLIGLITAFITSFYMFRLWFLTFFGEYRGTPAENAEHAAHEHAQHATTGHGHIHESPKVMTIPLAILAVLSVVGGWIGGARFDHFLEPVMRSPATEAAAEHGNELLLALMSVLVAILGLALAWLMYYRRRDLPAKAAAWFGSVYQLVLNKYYVDEIYNAVFVKPLIAGSNLLWRGIDAGAIDGTIDGAARGAQELSNNMRHMESGNLRSYASWVAMGALAVMIYMVVMGVK